MYSDGTAAYINDDSQDYRDSQWHHAVISKNENIISMWVDGSLVGSASNAMEVSNSSDLLVGYSESGDSPQRRYWSGKIDDIRIYDRPLSEEEVRAVYTDAYTHEFAYDYRSRRIFRSTPSETNLCVFDGGLSIQEYDATSSLIPQASTLSKEYIRGEGMGGGVGGMVYSIDHRQSAIGNVICSHANHRGDVIVRSDMNGELTSFALYEAYGTRPYEWGDDPDRQKANTKEEEKDLGLLCERMRYRDLETGTFLSRDPIGYEDGPNIYCYVNCNPITKFDPLGLSGMVPYGMTMPHGAMVANASEETRMDYYESSAFIADAFAEGALGGVAIAADTYTLGLSSTLGAAADAYQGPGRGASEVASAISFNAAAVATGAGALNASGSSIVAAEVYGMTQSAALGGSASEVIQAGGAGVLLSSVASAGLSSVPAQNAVANMAGNTVGQLSTGTPISDLSWSSIAISGGAGYGGGMIMGLGGSQVMTSLGNTTINSTEAYIAGVLTTWLYDTAAQSMNQDTENSNESLTQNEQEDDTLSDSASTTPTSTDEEQQ
ncbi:LamG-like jellyroll fold domain-containing protein [Tichowtungia aerotolerans]|uniref:LamG-like jellyroll fold domain-containing protein n=1 Tax=Tichowtungia aerotolerans TaxID=2697043 RepID=A0A6P1M286_9BACT|nr:LamG-like jellyroll fold domain-containing protein [Tichowtungia aerotolerans]QHI68700.1 hypothetical protein GT409_04310 [Tichowtungia aerotolerans]